MGNHGDESADVGSKEHLEALTPLGLCKGCGDDAEIVVPLMLGKLRLCGYCCKRTLILSEKLMYPLYIKKIDIPDKLTKEQRYKIQKFIAGI